MMARLTKTAKILSLALVVTLIYSGQIANSEPGIESDHRIEPKAVLVVGPIDPPSNVQTNSSISEAIEATIILEKHGVQVITLFHPDASWAKVVKASQDANIFMYWGHGFDEASSNIGSVDDSYGLVLSSIDPNEYETVSRDQLVSQIALAPNSVVVLSHTCYAAGDNQSERYVNAPKAARYASNYSSTFLSMGAEAYFANNFEGSAVEYIRNLFYGNNDMKDIFFSSSVFSGSDLIRKNHPIRGFGLMLDPVTDQNGKTLFSQAFAGKTDLKARDVLMPGEGKVPGY